MTKSPLKPDVFYKEGVLFLRYPSGNMRRIPLPESHPNVAPILQEAFKEGVIAAHNHIAKQYGEEVIDPLKEVVIRDVV